MNVSSRLINTCLFLWFSLSMVSAQEPIFRELTSDDGLPSNIVYKIAEGHGGQMWIATDNGVCIYDREDIVEAKFDSVNDHFFAFMEQDSYGNIWMLNISGQIFVNSQAGLERKQAPGNVYKSYSSCG